MATMLAPPSAPIMEAFPAREPEPSATSARIPTSFVHLRDRVLDGPSQRVQFDHEAFFTGAKWRTYDRLVLGTRSAYDPRAQRKFTDRHDWPIAPHELARPYLNWIHAEQRHGREGSRGNKQVPWRRESLPMLDLPAPMFYSGHVTEGDLTYVDINACYWQLYTSATLDLDYAPERQRLGVGRIEFLNPGDLRGAKGLRNSVIGVTRTTAVDEARHGVVRRRRTFNKHLSPELWGYIAHTLHAIMREAVERFGACYVHTDGIVVPADRGEAVIRWLADEWRLESSVRATGPGRVWGLGAYEIGERRSRALVTHGLPICNLLDLDPVLTAALRRWRTFLVERPRGDAPAVFS